MVTPEALREPPERRVGSVSGVGLVLTTERLVLRPVTAHDHAALLAHWTLPEVRRFLFDGVALSDVVHASWTVSRSPRAPARAGLGAGDHVPGSPD